MSSVAGQSLAIGNLGKVGHTDSQLSSEMLRSEKLQSFVSRYLELSNELRDKHGEKGAYLQLGKIFTERVGERVMLGGVQGRDEALLHGDGDGE